MLFLSFAHVPVRVQGLASLSRGGARKLQVHQLFAQGDGGLQSGSEEPPKSEDPVAKGQIYSFL